MPFYEYECPKCKTIFEETRPISQAAEDCPCPKCKTLSKRVISKFMSHINTGSFLDSLPPTPKGNFMTE